MITRRGSAKPLLAVLVLTLVGVFGVRFSAASAGQENERPGIEQAAPSEADPSDADPYDTDSSDTDQETGKSLDGSDAPEAGQELQAPSSNQDAKTGRDLKSGEPQPSPNGESAPDPSVEDLQLGEPGRRDKVLAELYDQLGRAKDAEAAGPISDAIQQVWRLSGSDTIDLLISRADTFVKQSDLDMALQVLNQVVELAPQDAEGWHQRAMVHYLQHDDQQALTDIRRALVIDPQHYKALDGLGVVLQRLGDKKGALEAYRKALKVNPFLDSARQAVEELSRAVEGQDI